MNHINIGSDITHLLSSGPKINTSVKLELKYTQFPLKTFKSVVSKKQPYWFRFHCIKCCLSYHWGVVICSAVQPSSTHWGLVTTYELGHHWFSCLVPSHYLNKCWLIVNWTTDNRFQWNFNHNVTIFWQENWLQNTFCQITAILSFHPLVKRPSSTCFIGEFGETLMMTSSNGNIFRVIGPLCGEFTGPRWIPHTKASDAELWCLLWSAPE